MTSPAHFDFRAWRRALGLTQEAAAARLGISRVYLAMLETGKKRPSEPLTRLAQALAREQDTSGKLCNPGSPLAVR